MGIIKEFKAFALKSSVAEIGIGLVMGAAFNELVNSLVKDLMLPPAGWLLSKSKLDDRYFSLSGNQYDSLSEARASGDLVIAYGSFIDTLIYVIILMFALFLTVRVLNRWKKPGERPMDNMLKKECPYCRSSVALKATRCPFCTSTLQNVSGAAAKTPFTPKIKIK